MITSGQYLSRAGGPGLGYLEPAHSNSVSVLAGFICKQFVAIQ